MAKNYFTYDITHKNYATPNQKILFQKTFKIIVPSVLCGFGKNLD